MSNIRYNDDQRRFILMNWAELKRLPLNQKQKLDKFKAEFAAKYPEVPIPSKATIYRLAEKFRKTSSVADRKRQRSKEKRDLCAENIRYIKYEDNNS